MPKFLHPAIQAEDLFLFFWLAVIQPLLTAAFGSAVGDTNPTEIGNQTNLLLGIVFVFASLGAIAVLATRSPGDTDPERSGGVTSFAHLPMIISLSLFLVFAIKSFGLPGEEFVVCLLIAFFFLVGMLWSRLPIVPSVTRRVLITPMVILGGWFFTGISSMVFQGVTLQTLLNPPDLSNNLDPRGAVMTYVALTSLFVLVYYLAFILAPRAIAGGATSWRGWVVRFALYLAGVLLNGATRLF